MDAPIGVINFLYHLVIEESKKRKADEEAKEKKRQLEERNKHLNPRRQALSQKLPSHEKLPKVAGVSMEDLEDELA